ncbi:hypothetical protein J3998_07715 [Thiomicrorhabdus sp. 6S2-11]|jgi:hypothetical protein|uniref:Uncharacterized protein n=1 Tax=Thiomicrorhabdus marina TaxID=2818442 RepID=A0ABS3Q550_9GAMM|nr:hypothetical protein [Thiomicrorhabdus marina]MBO1927463.1 hypothetical protein [Thiomicrorhabdus marina]
MKLINNMASSTMNTFLGAIALSLATITPTFAENAPSSSDKAELQQKAQNYAICAALSKGSEQQTYTDKLTALLKQQNTKQQKSYSDQQISELSTNKISELKRNFREYSEQSQNKLYGKLCRDSLKMDENFVGLEFKELPLSLQQKMRSIATCALISDSLQLKQQAKQLTAANTLIMVAAGLNGRNQALSQLTELHNSIIEELKPLSEEQIKAQFNKSCSAVQQIQQQRHNAKP